MWSQENWYKPSSELVDGNAAYGRIHCSPGGRTRPIHAVEMASFLGEATRAPDNGRSTRFSVVCLPMTRTTKCADHLYATGSITLQNWSRWSLCCHPRRELYLFDTFFPLESANTSITNNKKPIKREFLANFGQWSWTNSDNKIYFDRRRCTNREHDYCAKEHTKKSTFQQDAKKRKEQGAEQRALQSRFTPKEQNTGSTWCGGREAVDLWRAMIIDDME